MNIDYVKSKKFKIDRIILCYYNFKPKIVRSNISQAEIENVYKNSHIYKQISSLCMLISVYANNG